MPARLTHNRDREKRDSQDDHRHIRQRSYSRDSQQPEGIGL